MPRSKELLRIGSRNIPITNVEKVLYPESGFTKGQVIDYYIRVADTLLPHLSNRPVTLKRYPNGVAAPHFYEKQAPKFTPEWVKTFAVARRGRPGNIDYILVNDLSTLVWTANLANLEIHPFLHRIPNIDRPTSIVFDLDPGEDVNVLGVAKVAFLIRDLLDQRGLESFIKVSGSKGLQLYVPLNTAVTYEQTQPFAKSVAESMERQYPQLTTATMAKAVRRGKVFIDWSQNSDFKTTVAVYSLRGKSGRPLVSMPLRWDELEAAVQANDPDRLYFSPEAAIARIEEVGDLFQPVLKLKQRLTAKARRVVERPYAVEFIAPMLAKPVNKLPEGAKWRYEIKLDGYRALAARSGKTAKLYSRRGNLLDKKFPEIYHALNALPDRTTVDGEVVALDEQGLPSFSALQNAHSTSLPLFYYIFDVLVLDGTDLRKTPFVERRKLLDEALEGLADPLRLSAVFDANSRKMIAAVKKQGLEGIVAKRANSLYEAGERSGAWVKYKTNQGQELVIGGYVPGRYGFDSLLAGYYEGGNLIFVAKINNGFVPALRVQIAKRFKGLETTTCPFANLPEPRSARRGEALTREVMAKCRWLKPELVAQVEFTEWTAASHLRHSRFVGLRDDKEPTSVVRERAA